MLLTSVEVKNFYSFDDLKLTCQSITTDEVGRTEEDEELTPVFMESLDKDDQNTFSEMDYLFGINFINVT